MFKVTVLVVLVASSFAQEFWNDEAFQLSDLLDDAADEPQADENVRVRRDFYGGRFGLPGGRRTQQFGYSGSVYTSPVMTPNTAPRHDISAWGDMSQSINRRGMTGPITYSGGANWLHQGTKGLSGSVAHIPHLGSQATAGGHATLFSNDNHRLTAGVQHSQDFDKNFRRLGPGSNTASLTYEHDRGATVGISGTRTAGSPDSGTVSASVPVASFAGGKGQVSLNAGSTFADGHKPNNQVGLEVKITP